MVLFMKCVVRKTHDDALRYGGYCARWYTSMSEWVNRTCGFSPPSFAFDHHLTYRQIHSPTRWTLEKCLFKERGEFDPFSGNKYCRILSPLWWRFVTVNFFVCKKKGEVCVCQRWRRQTFLHMLRDVSWHLLLVADFVFTRSHLSASALLSKYLSTLWR